ncbi:MAG: PIN domain-containing protein, partial [Alphaproteobacteria bacterium]|nr:PIN domain-containing protein [Alphaproteobacteria bacterium]
GNRHSEPLRKSTQNCAKAGKMRKPKPAVSTVYLDANAFIYLIDGDPAASGAVQPLFEALRARPGVGVTSEISLAEVLAGRDARTRRLYLDLMVFGQFLVLVPVSRDVLYETVDLRKVAKMKLIDAIHLATAIGSRCRHFVTRDGDFRRMPRGMTKVVPDAAAISDLVAKIPL